MNVHTSKKLWIAYLDVGAFEKDQTVVEADSPSEAIKKAEEYFAEKHPIIKEGGFSISVEKAVGTSDSVEPDYHGVTL